MAHHECEKVAAETCPVGQGKDRCDVCSVIGQVEDSADAKQRAKRKGVDRHLNVVRKYRTCADLVSLVQIFPPVSLRFDVKFAKRRLDADELRKLWISFRPYEADQTKYHEDAERDGRVAPGATERLRKVTSKKLLNTRTALRVSLINAAVRADDATTKIID